MKNIIFWIVISVFLQNTLLASDNFKSIFPLHSSGSLKFDVDLCQMDGPGDSTVVEIIYSVFLTEENARQAAEANTTTLSVDLHVRNKAGQSIAYVIEHKSVSLYDSLNHSKYTTFMDIKRFSILPDTVVLDLKIMESKNGTSGYVSKQFEIRKFTKDFSLGDLYFASHVQRAQGSSVFEKSGVMFIPNPSRLFFVNGEAPKIFVYYEINNLTYKANKPTYYEVSSIVQDMAGNNVLTNTRKQIKVTAGNTSRIKVIPIAQFNSGIYHVIIEVQDIASGSKKEVSGYFKVDKGNVSETNILPMSELEEKKYLDQIKYIASDREKEMFKKLDARGKQEFLLQFWKSKDPQPGTPENEFMIEHFRRLDVAQRRFKGGSDSDMGRIYIRYGPPEDIERDNAMMMGAQSIETWVYILDGRTDFVFVDRDGDGNYALIHSTHRDEYSNPGWKEQIDH